MKAISIIVPVYNVADFLPRCIESILNQSLSDFELILVDDGSTDESGSICDEYAASDSRIKVIHTENAGVSAARNLAIQAASGEYIGFIDGDDWADTEMYSRLYSNAAAHNADIAMCDSYESCGNSLTVQTVHNVSKSGLLSKSDITAERLLLMAGSACLMIYRREFIVSNKISFPLGMKISEDRVFNLYALGKCAGMYYDKTPLYYRFVRENSAVNKYYSDFLSMVLTARDRTMKAIDDAFNADEVLKSAYEKQTVALCYVALNNTFYKNADTTWKEKLTEVKRICNCKEFLNALRITKAKDIRAKLVMRKSYVLIALLSKLANIIHGR